MKKQPINQPLENIEHWEEDLIKRYPEPNTSEKEKEDFRNYDESDRAETVREFYRLNHKYQTYDFVCKKER